MSQANGLLPIGWPEATQMLGQSNSQTHCCSVGVRSQPRKTSVRAIVHPFLSNYPTSALQCLNSRQSASLLLQLLHLPCSVYFRQSSWQVPINVVHHLLKGLPPLPFLIDPASRTTGIRVLLHTRSAGFKALFASQAPFG